MDNVRRVPMPWLRDLRLLAATLAALLLSAIAPAVSLAADDLILDVTLSGAAPFVGDDEGRFEERHGASSGISGGVEDFTLQQLLGRSGFAEVRGHALIDEHDYLVDVAVEPSERVSLRGGFREFRVWDDASGGYFPGGAGTFLPVLGDDLHLDRSRAWIHAALRDVGLRQIDLRYTRQEREGRKGSLVWGDTTATGGAGTRSIVPSFWQVDEATDTFELELGDKVKNTKLGGGIRFQTFDLTNSRNQRRNPGESGLDRFVTQSDLRNGDRLGLNARTESRFKKGKVVLTSGYSFARVRNDIAGSRIYGDGYGASFSPSFGNRQAFEREFLDLKGATQLRLHVGNLNLMLRPLRNLRMTSSLRLDEESLRSSASYQQVALDPRQTPSLATAALSARSRSQRSTLTAAFDVRYTGLSSVVLYAGSEWAQTDGELSERLLENGASSVRRDTDTDRTAQEVLLGATWYPLARLSVSGNYRYARRENDYDHRIDSTDNRLGGDRYPAFFVSDEIERNTLNLRTTWRALNNLSLIARYDFDLSSIDSRAEGLAEVESAEITSHIVGATAAWNPASSVYVQANGSYALSQTDTVADELNGATGRLVPDFDNDYWSADLSGGWAPDESTDLRARYYFYRAEDYVDNSAVTQPFGSHVEEHGVRVELGRKISEATRVTAGYGFVQAEDRESGGKDDYQVHLITAELEFKY